MRQNLAGFARSALTAASARETGATRAAPVAFDETAPGVVADVCVRGALGFVCLLHRRKDGLVAEELYFSAREDDGPWEAAEHLSGGVLGFDPTDPRSAAAPLDGRALIPFGDSETCLFTGRQQADDGYELLRFFTFLVAEEADHLVVGGGSSGTVSVRKPLVSRIALLAVLPGERLTVRAAAREGSGAGFPDAAYELTGAEPGPAHGAVPPDFPPVGEQRCRPVPPPSSGPDEPGDVPGRWGLRGAPR
ncbi:hypothetical protein [Streptomyces sp. PTD5-9]|uniref:hypothetical protein n=1 Tax=Streptomyces sp. PTD5-9 TaxID=3120150 RepID=UPI00300A24AA